MCPLLQDTVRVSEHLAPSSHTCTAFAGPFLQNHSNLLTSFGKLHPRDCPKERYLLLLALLLSIVKASEEGRARRV